MSADDEVRKASEQFYAALNRMANGDAGPMADIWSHSATVTAMHPVGGRDIGWERIRDTFQQVGQAASDGRFRLDDQMIRVEGDVAYEMGSERGEFKLAGKHVNADHRVTNIYHREGGKWKLIHHHTDISQPMLDVLKEMRCGKPPKPVRLRSV